MHQTHHQQQSQANNKWVMTNPCGWSRRSLLRLMATLRQAFPTADTYSNGTDYFLADPGRAQWGPHLERLQAVKRRVDPANLFRVHNGIGNLQA